MAAAPCRDVEGFSLLEAVVAAGLLAGLLTGLMPLTTAARNGAAWSRRDLLAAHLARQRVHHLQALTHVALPAGAVRDTDSLLQGGDIAPGGPGLTPTGMAPLTAPLPGASDWLDARGAALPWSATAPPGAEFLRQWMVVDDGSPCLRVWVSVRPVAGAGRALATAGALQCAWGAGLP